MIGTIRATEGVPVLLEGYAQDFSYAIDAIEFSADEGATWTAYAVERADPSLNVNWSFVFTPPRQGFYRILVRSVRSDGAVSPEPAVVGIEACPNGDAAEGRPHCGVDMLRP